MSLLSFWWFFFFQAEDGIRDGTVTGVQTCALPICAVDLGLHFAIGFAGSSLLATIVQPSPLALIAVLAIVGLGAWLFLARRRHASSTVALHAWAQATCPVCLAVGAIA